MPIKIELVGFDALSKIGSLMKRQKELIMTDLVDASKRFGAEAVYIAKKNYLSAEQGDKSRLHHRSGRLASSINAKVVRDGNTVETSVGTNVKYAAIHEFGGMTHPNVTARMRDFAWAMFYKTKDVKFKRMALTKKSRLDIKIPPRPFLSTSVRDAMPSFRDNIKRVLGKVSFQEVA